MMRRRGRQVQCASPWRRTRLCLAVLSVAALLARVLTAQSDEPHNAVERLQAALNRGEVTLEFENEFGYLRSVLSALNIPLSSQALVFSRTSLAQQFISPGVPRAIYFADDVYVGFVRNGLPLEFAAMGSDQRPAFFSLDQQAAERPQIQRDNTCLLCHDPSRRGTTHLIMRSHFTDYEGNAFQARGVPGLIVDITDRTPFDLRWGGWYVTGTHGAQRHLGNMFALDRVTTIPNQQLEAYAARLDRTKGANLTDLSRLLDTSLYLTGHSDIVALMVLGHQVGVENAIAVAAGAQTDIDIKRYGEPLVRALFLANAAPLSAPVEGTTRFTAEFAARGPRDSHGRSLRDLDLTTRLFRYPLSFLIYSEAFTRLPPPVSQFVKQRIREVLAGQDQSPAFSHLTPADRQAISEILQETKPDVLR
jgi:hypothetical protein